MTSRFSTKRRLLLVAAAAAALGTGMAQAAPGNARPVTAKSRPTAKVASLPPGTQRPSSEVLLSLGQGQLVTLPANAAEVWTSNPNVADVYVNSPRQIYVFGKDTGEATVKTNSPLEAIFCGCPKNNF